jgi:capsid protein
VIHWFPKFRPGQVRGVPVFTPALDLFTELRSFRKAVLAKANVAANLTAVLESEAPADADGTQTSEPFDSVPSTAA